MTESANEVVQKVKKVIGFFSRKRIAEETEPKPEPEQQNSLTPDVKKIFREKANDRINLESTIAQILSGQYSFTFSKEVYSRSFSSIEGDPVDLIQSREAQSTEIWEKSKEDINSLAAIFIDEVWSELDHERKNFEFLLKRPENDISAEFEKQLREALLRKIYDLFEQKLNEFDEKRRRRLELPREQWDALDVAYDHFCAIIQFGHDHFTVGAEESGFAQSPGEFILSGVGTAVEVTFSIYQIVADLLRKDNRQLSEEEIDKCERQAYGPIVQFFASMNLKKLVPILKFLRKDKNSTSSEEELEQKIGLSSDYFSLHHDSEGYKLKLDHTVLFDIKDSDGNRVIEKNETSPTTWCPARYQVGEGKDVVRQLYEWCLEVDKKFIRKKTK